MSLSATSATDTQDPWLSTTCLHPAPPARCSLSVPVSLCALPAVVSPKRAADPSKGNIRAHSRVESKRLKPQPAEPCEAAGKIEQQAEPHEGETVARTASRCSGIETEDVGMEGKNIVRVSPALLGRIGEAAEAVSEGSLIVQFAGRSVEYNADKEWHVTHAILSNSLAVSSHETRAKRNEQVDDVMRFHQLTHIGWLRQASATCPLSTLDLDTQRVYEDHLPDSFAAMLDMAHGESGPVVYFYCLCSPAAAQAEAGYSAFAAAHHVVLDTSVPFSVVEVSLSSGATQSAAAVQAAAAAAAASGRGPQKLSIVSKDTGSTMGTGTLQQGFPGEGTCCSAQDEQMAA